VTRGLALPLTATLLVGLSAACQSRQESYCSALRDERDTIVELNRLADRPRDGAIVDTLEVFERLRDEAPGDLADEWDTYIRAWRGLHGALDRAGADESLFADGKRPAGVSDAEYAAIRAAAEQLRSPRVVDAATGIEQQGRDVCDVDLSGSQLR
jgi:hypothetical protein